MTLDLDLLLKFVTFAISIGAMVYAFFANRRKDVDQRFHDGTQRMNRIDARVTRLEQEIKTLPGTADMHQLQLQLSELNGSLREVHAVMEGNAKVMTRVEAIVSRHEDHLLEGAK